MERTAAADAGSVTRCRQSKERYPSEFPLKCHSPRKTKSSYRIRISPEAIAAFFVLYVLKSERKLPANLPAGNEANGR